MKDYEMTSNNEKSFYPWKLYASRLRAAAELFEGCDHANGTLFDALHEIKPEIEALLHPIDEFRACSDTGSLTLSCTQGTEVSLDRNLPPVSHSNQDREM